MDSEERRRIGVISRADRTPSTAEERRAVRSTAMLGWGVVALVIGLFGLAGGGSPTGLLLGILGVGLLVGGLILRR